MLVLAGVGATHWFDRGGIEEFYRHGPEDWVAILKPITKKAFTVARPDTAVETFLRAYQTALSGRPGPAVVMAIPFDIQNTLIPDDLPDPTPYMVSRPPSGRPPRHQRSDRTPKDGRATVRSRRQRHRELPCLGRPTRVRRGDQSARGHDTVGKAAFPEDHRLALGCIGRAGTGQGNHGARAPTSSSPSLRTSPTSTLADGRCSTSRTAPVDPHRHRPDELGRAYPTAVAMTSMRGSVSRRSQRRPGRLASPSGRRGPPCSRQAGRMAGRDRAHAHLRHRALHYARVTGTPAAVVAARSPDASVHFDTGNILSYGPSFLPASSHHVVHFAWMHRMGWSAASVLGASRAAEARRRSPCSATGRSSCAPPSCRPRSN